MASKNVLNLHSFWSYFIVLDLEDNEKSQGHGS